jgi:hypothetical protein
MKNKTDVAIINGLALGSHFTCRTIFGVWKEQQIGYDEYKALQRQEKSTYSSSIQHK